MVKKFLVSWIMKYGIEAVIRVPDDIYGWT
jgi:hypothetical protein